MAPPQIPSPCVTEPIPSATMGLLVDEMLDWYVEWGEATLAAADAYRLWSDTPAGQKAAAFAAYTVALDEEAYAANTYAEALSKVKNGP